MWLADQLEHAAERGRLAEAMAASLTEAESLKAAAGPWQQQPEAELRRRFAASALLAMVRRPFSGPAAASAAWGKERLGTCRSGSAM